MGGVAPALKILLFVLTHRASKEMIVTTTEEGKRAKQILRNERERRIRETEGELIRVILSSLFLEGLDKALLLLFFLHQNRIAASLPPSNYYLLSHCSQGGREKPVRKHFGPTKKEPRLGSSSRI